MLRNSISPDLAPPFKGLNLRDPGHQLQPGEVVKMQNLYWDGFIRMIPGTTLLPSVITVPMFTLDISKVYLTNPSTVTPIGF